jgi:hypothetical protein
MLYVTPEAKETVWTMLALFPVCVCQICQLTLDTLERFIAVQLRDVTSNSFCQLFNLVIGQTTLPKQQY